MKKFLLAAVAAASGLTSVSALAQPYYGSRGGYYSRDYDRDRDYRDHDYRDRDYRNGDYRRYGYNGRWREGQVYPYYRYRNHMLRDWRAYHLPPPRPGYAYYYDDNGDVVMAALASGIIGLVIGNALANQNNDYQQPYGYGSPYGYPYPYR